MDPQIYDSQNLYVHAELVFGEPKGVTLKSLGRVPVVMTMLYQKISCESLFATENTQLPWGSARGENEFFSKVPGALWLGKGSLMQEVKYTFFIEIQCIAPATADEYMTKHAILR